MKGKLRQVKAVPNQDVITALSDALSRAKTGKVRGVLIVTEEPREVVGQYIYGNYEIFKMIGALEVAKQDLLNQCDQIAKGELESAASR